MLTEIILMTDLNICRIEIILVQRSKRPNKLALKAELNIRSTDSCDSRSEENCVRIIVIKKSGKAASKRGKCKRNHGAKIPC